MKSGRELYKSARHAINLVELIFGVFPSCVFENTWWLVRSMPGLIGLGLRYIYFRRLTASCGEVVQIGAGVTIKSWKNLSIGNRVNIHERCYIDAVGGVEIGDDVSIAHDCSVLSFEHTWEDPDIPMKYNRIINKPIVLESDVVIGCGVRILGGAVLRKRTFVAANAVVKGETNPFSLYGGVPAKKIKEINQ